MLLASLAAVGDRYPELVSAGTVVYEAVLASDRGAYTARRAPGRIGATTVTLYAVD